MKNWKVCVLLLLLTGVGALGFEHYYVGGLLAYVGILLAILTILGALIGRVSVFVALILLFQAASVAYFLGKS